jgi:glyoxylate reductase/D-3-phosphoglycerate dehydrogenase/(S)-sulfolactate dehydrogenase
MPNLRFMQRLGRLRARGDASAARERGIPVSVLPHGTSLRVAEHAFALILGLFRGLLAAHRSVLDGSNPASLPPERGESARQALNWAGVPGLQSLQFKSVGIAGFGEIGACLAHMLAPMQCRVLYYKRTRLSSAQEEYLGVSYAPMEQLLGQSDVVCDLIPGREENRATLGERELGLMKRTAYFVNVGRGITTDENALARALAEDRIAGAGLDVFTIEPLQPGHPFLSLSNVLLTPHIAGGTPLLATPGTAGWLDTFERLVENLRRVGAGEPVLSPINPLEPPLEPTNMAARLPPLMGEIRDMR